MIRNARALISVLLVGSLLLIAACGGDDDSDDGDNGADAGGSEATAASNDANGGGNGGNGGSSASGGGATGGSLTLGDETIEFDRARCFLEEQDVSGSPGKILFVGQGFGTTADGQDVTLDVSRYDEDSNFTGDDIIIDIGPLGDSTTWQVVAELGTVEQDGRTLTASGLTLQNFDDFSETPGAFTLEC